MHVLAAGAQTAALDSGAADPGMGESTAIAFDQIGAEADKHLTEGEPDVVATPWGAMLTARFQDLAGEVDSSGLWLHSTAEQTAGVPLHVKAAALGRGMGIAYPFAATGSVNVGQAMARFERPGIVEEYSVSIDGVRQDFLLLERPEGVGQLRLELSVAGATARTDGDSISLVLDDSGRALAYNRLHVSDSAGKTLPARLEAAGAQRIVVAVDDQNATWPLRVDPTFSDADWTSITSSVADVNGTVYALAVSGNDLYVGGEFTRVGGVSANNVAKWDGTNWSALGSGVENGGNLTRVYALAVSGTDLYVGGIFTTAGGSDANYIAKWNGRRSGTALVSGGNNGVSSTVNALAVSGTDLYVGGQFNTAGGDSAKNPWPSGTAAVGPPGRQRERRCPGPGGERHRPLCGRILHHSRAGAGPATSPSGTAATWFPLGSGVNDLVMALAVSGNDLYVGGGFSTAGGSGGQQHRQVGRQQHWSALDSGVNGLVEALAVSDSDLYVGGRFTTASGLGASRIAKWDGSGWAALGSGMNNFVQALAMSGSDLYVGGDFTTAGNKVITYLARAQNVDNLDNDPPSAAPAQSPGANAVRLER